MPSRRLIRVAQPAVVALAALVAVAFARQSGPTPRHAAPTFSKDVAPIIYKNCASCHHPGGLGPFSLVDYDSAKAQTDKIEDAVSSNTMPPWHAEGPHGVFRNDRRLSDADKQIILDWIAGGAQRGDAKDLPPKPDFPSTWSIGTPDFVVSMPEDFVVPADRHDRVPVLHRADESHRRQMGPGDRDPAGRARGRAPRARLRARAARSGRRARGSSASPRRHRRPPSRSSFATGSSPCSVTRRAPTRFTRRRAGARRAHRHDRSGHQRRRVHAGNGAALARRHRADVPDALHGARPRDEGSLARRIPFRGREAAGRDLCFAVRERRRSRFRRGRRTSPSRPRSRLGSRCAFGGSSRTRICAARAGATRS